MRDFNGALCYGESNIVFIDIRMEKKTKTQDLSDFVFF